MILFRQRIGGQSPDAPSAAPDLYDRMCFEEFRGSTPCVVIGAALQLINRMDDAA
ncbi:hypothetical protein [Bradyrhizobium sp. WSM1743]|uniref:hypothetical protein n=1 Tax=Bradyrhizobium sp. WSM1743 TaxID=318996 RepID=UPI0004167572|nr:hypothetical protein [Bradyrhizobium sp. WSM1743]